MPPGAQRIGHRAEGLVDRVERRQVVDRMARRPRSRRRVAPDRGQREHLELVGAGRGLAGEVDHRRRGVRARARDVPPRSAAGSAGRSRSRTRRPARRPRAPARGAQDPGRDGLGMEVEALVVDAGEVGPVVRLVHRAASPAPRA